MIVRRIAVGACLACAFLGARAAAAHEVRPAYLEIRETAAGRYDVQWRTPVAAGRELDTTLSFPDDVREVKPPLVAERPGERFERRWIDAGPAGLDGRRIGFPGLERTTSDVVVRFEHADGSETTELVHPARPLIELSPRRGRWQAGGAFFIQGVRHILLGVDHLLFVLGLLLLVRTLGMLLKTVTAFTVAHSVTLAVATLTRIHLAAAPLNAAIALSILFLGPEIVRSRRGETSFTIRHPWVVAFAFGLLHGFGFASGLTTIGLPHADLPVALLAFNLGVEAGQLAFVSLMLLMKQAFRVLEFAWPRPVTALPAYAVGSLGAFWTIERIAVMIAGR